LEQAETKAVRRLSLAVVAVLFVAIASSSPSAEGNSPFPAVSASPQVALPKADADGWSREVSGLEARLTLVDRGIGNGTRWLVPYLELRNVRDAGNPMEVNLDGRRLQVELVGEEGKPLGLRPRPGHSGPVGPLGTVTLPRDSTIRISLAIGGWSVPKGADALVDSRRGAYFVYEREKGKVFLRATLTAEGPTAPLQSFATTWSGNIQTPLLKLDWK
jgi:hypothetical protein